MPVVEALGICAQGISETAGCVSQHRALSVMAFIIPAGIVFLVWGALWLLYDTRKDRSSSSTEVLSTGHALRLRYSAYFFGIGFGILLTATPVLVSPNRVIMWLGVAASLGLGIIIAWVAERRMNIDPVLYSNPSSEILSVTEEWMSFRATRFFFAFCVILAYVNLLRR